MEIIRYLQTFSSPFLDTVFQAITMLGEDTLFILLAVIWIWCFDKKLGLRFGLIALSSALVNVTVKEIYKSPRPVGAEGIRSIRLETAGGYSFPSGHSQFAATNWTNLARYVRKNWFNILAGTLIILVGLSRLYLGVHYPKDVIFGILIGVLWAFVGAKIIDLLEKRPLAYLFIGFLLLLTLPFFKNPDYFKIASASAGICIGIFLERKYVNFSEKAPLYIQVIKIVFGLLVLTGIQSGLKLVLPVNIYSDGLRYLLIGLWATAIAPLCFVSISKRLKQNAA